MNQKGYGPERKSKGFAPILIILLIALAVGGYFIYKNLQKSTSAPQQATQPQTTTSDETANWKTYISKESGFAFKAPADWKLLDEAPNAIILTSPDFNNKFGKPGDNFGEEITSGSRFKVVTMGDRGLDTRSLEKMATDECNGAAKIVGNTTITGVTAVRYTSRGCYEGRINVNSILFLKENKDFRIIQEYSYNRENPYPDLLDQVAATFKFTQ